jgi:protein gp37
VATKTHIEWTELTWNPVTGCSKVSQGCANCYAERMAKRLRAMGVARYRDGFQVTLHPDLLEAPFHWKGSRKVFVNSMSDLFHESVPTFFIRRVFDTMTACQQHTFQILTKRSSRLQEVATGLRWPPNVWMGVSVENEQAVHRVHDLQSVPASVRFLSIEPLLGPINKLPLEGIGWVIVGGESGPGARPMETSWVQSIFRQCRRSKVSFFFKQWGGVRKDRTGRLFNGRTYDEMPTIRKSLGPPRQFD